MAPAVDPDLRLPATRCHRKNYLGPARRDQRFQLRPFVRIASGLRARFGIPRVLPTFMLIPTVE